MMMMMIDDWWWNVDIMDRMDEHMMPAAVADPRKDLDMFAMIFVQVQVSQNHQQLKTKKDPRHPSNAWTTWLWPVEPNIQLFES